MLIQVSALYFICSSAGLALIVGGIWLIYKQKIYIDKATNQVTEVNLPFFGKLRTNVPALVLFFVGAALLVYPIHKDQVSYLRVAGKVTTQLHPVNVYAVVEVRQVSSDGTFELPIPNLPTGAYAPQVVYIAGTDPIIIDFDVIDLGRQKKGIIDLVARQISGTQRAEMFVPDVTKPPVEFTH